MMIQSGHILATFLLILGALNHSNGTRVWSKTTSEGSGIHYHYTVDDSNGNKQSKDESIRNTTVSGRYKTLLPDGRLQIVTYNAGKNGFKPIIKYEKPKQARTSRLQVKPVETIHYQYSINDDNGNKQSKRESIRNTTVSGKYKILLPDGRLQIVTYTASKNGFKPKIKYEIPKEAQTNRLELKPVEVKTSPSSLNGRIRISKASKKSLKLEEESVSSAAKKTKSESLLPSAA